MGETGFPVGFKKLNLYGRVSFSTAEKRATVELFHLESPLHGRGTRVPRGASLTGWYRPDIHDRQVQG